MRLIMFIHSPKQTHLGWRKSHQIATWSIFIAVLHWPRLKLPQTSPCSSMACSMYNWQQPVREATAKRAKYVKEPSPSHVVPLVEFTQNMRAGLHAIGAPGLATCLLCSRFLCLFPSPFFAFVLDTRSFHPIRQTLSGVCVCERADKKKRHPPTFISLLHHDSSTRILNHPFAKCATIVPANSGKHPCSSGYNIISSRCTKSSLRADLVACFVCAKPSSGGKDCHQG